MYDTENINIIVIAFRIFYKEEIEVKFCYVDFPKNADFNPEKEGWKKLKEPNIILTQLVAMPIGAMLFFAINYLMILLTEYRGLTEYFEKFNIKTSLLACLIIIPLHELLHAVMFPKGLKSNDTVIGFYPKGVAFYAYCSGDIPRSKYLMSSFSPLVFLSILPIFIMHFTGYNMLMFNICILNAVSACADMFGVILIMCQVPGATILKNNGSRTYWKELQKVS